MTKEMPSITGLVLASFLWLIVSVVLTLIWSYYSSEWWSVAFVVVAAFIFAEAIVHAVGAHMIYYKYQA